MSTAVDTDRGLLINTVAWLFTGLAIVTVSLKLFTRSKTVKLLGWDDIFIFLSMVSSFPDQEQYADANRRVVSLQQHLSPTL